MFRSFARRLVGVVTLLLVSGAAAAQLAPSGSGDWMAVTSVGSVRALALPRADAGEPLPLVPSDALLVAASYLSDGSLIAVREVITPFIGSSFFLEELDESGQLDRRGGIGLRVREAPVDLAATSDGGLYLLTDWLEVESPPTRSFHLLELAPSTGAILSDRTLDRELEAIATAPDGLWALSDRALYPLEPSDGELGSARIEFEPQAFLAADTDSAGAVWAASEGGSQQLVRLDPATGSVRPGPSLDAPALSLAIERRCPGSATERCVQGGRFLIRVDWRDFQDVTGDGRIAPALAADTGLFWFFDPANWELLVKVLDGCDLNGSFWVFAGGITDVEYHLEVVDLETGGSWRYDNPLGAAAMTLNDTTAFSSCE